MKSMLYWKYLLAFVKSQGMDDFTPSAAWENLTVCWRTSEAAEDLLSMKWIIIRGFEIWNLSSYDILHTHCSSLSVVGGPLDVPTVIFSILDTKLRIDFTKCVQLFVNRSNLHMADAEGFQRLQIISNSLLDEKESSLV